MRVKMKSQEEIKQMYKDGLIEVLHTSDDGETTHYGIKDGGLTHVFTLSYDEYGAEYEVVDFENIVSKSAYDRVKILFKE